MFWQTHPSMSYPARYLIDLMEDTMRRSRSTQIGITLSVAFLVTLVTSCGVPSERLRTSSSSTNINYTIDQNGVATLFGNVEDSYERFEATRLASELRGVEKVNNLLTFSN